MTVTEKQAVKTAFYDYHIEAGAKMVEFAGFWMPIQYQGITAEHLAVRKNIGLFDLSHMGEIDLYGADTVDFLQRVTSNNVAALEVGQIQYSCMTRPDGGIVDDLLVYRLADRYMLVINAANIPKDLAWLESHLFGDVKLVNRSDDFSLLAIQGPQAATLMAELTRHNLDEMSYYTSAVADIVGGEMLFSRTGYTGEDGFELYVTREQTDALWQAVNEVGRRHDLRLIGLAARDSLRLEMKMTLYGHDIDETTNPVEAGLSWIVDIETDFIGRDEIARIKTEKPHRRLVCLELTERAVPRQGYQLLAEGEPVGQVTSGVFSPSLQKPIALGYVPRRHAKAGTQLELQIRNKRFAAQVVKPPFYKDGSHL
ncbi:MAG: glycine cleavage system aminomethyltransferase GcvT [candidate division Zixibacteria bacterium]|nr:glycine cleavage system aminomethyltransferase GcvT [candidate division Zixibacteria bacterium]MDH3935875.1 glycine cleavage system aminomethyltransferase GcvT [candidate division Zixibacteria bacterium]MDH4034962.1 glycine cleavage system aminomethyltransferase GcvT [candidate division Zixibacteria bacterium]